jgi:transcriptional regulator with XRE-family HTH domain
MRSLRRKLNMSQSVFAATMNVSPKLVQSWEQGARTPRRGDLRLIQVIEKHPSVIASLFPTGRRQDASRDNGHRPTPRRSKVA